MRISEEFEVLCTYPAQRRRYMAVMPVIFAVVLK